MILEVLSEYSIEVDDISVRFPEDFSDLVEQGLDDIEIIEAIIDTYGVDAVIRDEPEFQSVRVY